MTYQEMTESLLVKNLDRFMQQVINGSSLQFTVNYNGKKIKMAMESTETQGQKLARLLREQLKNQPIDSTPPITNNREIYDLAKKYD